MKGNFNKAKILLLMMMGILLIALDAFGDNKEDINDATDTNVETEANDESDEWTVVVPSEVLEASGCLS